MKRIFKSFGFFLLLIIAIFLIRIKLDPKVSLTLPKNETVTRIEKTVLGSETPAIKHIVILSMENKAYGEIVGNPNSPYLNSLIKQYSFATHYFATTHPSLPNYISLIGGSTFGINTDCQSCFISASNLVDQLEAQHLTWKAYMDSIPAPCFIGNSYPYAQKHNPFIYFDNIRNNPDRCSKIVSFDNFIPDFSNDAKAPNFSWISPNLCHDTHDCSVKSGDAWLSQEIPKILNTDAYKKGDLLLVITWDEAEGGGPNKIPTILIGKNVKEGFTSNKEYNHYSLLHTVESIWGLPPLTINVQNAPVMSDFFKNNP